MTTIVDRLAQAIRVADGNHNLGAGVLAERLMPLVNELRAEVADVIAGTSTGDYGYGAEGSGWYERAADSIIREAEDLAYSIRKGEA